MAAAGVGPWDGWIRAGKSALPQPLPLTLGSDLSGLIEVVGQGVEAFRVGDPVFGVTNRQFTGAYAEFAVASASMLARKPGSVTDVTAAAVPVIAVTAWQALFDHAQLQRGHTVLVHGAAGNVGSFAVQFARQAGLRIIATGGARDLAYLGELGADEVIDFQARQFETEVSGVDAVVDLVGGDTQRRSFQVLKPGGCLISAVSVPDQADAARYGVRASFFLVDVTTQCLDMIAGLIDSGSIRSRVGTVLSLGEAELAHEMLEGTRPRADGKIVLNISN